jgi:hypothetical protein
MDTERYGARAREEVVEYIVVFLRPWSQPEETVHKGVAKDLDLLFDIVAKSRKNARGWAESKKATRGLEPALTRLIDTVDRIPANNLLFKKPGFSSRAFLRDLQLLREMCATSERFKSVPKNVDLTQKFCAFFACGIISRFSKKNRRPRPRARCGQLRASCTKPSRETPRWI